MDKNLTSHTNLKLLKSQKTKSVLFVSWKNSERDYRKSQNSHAARLISAQNINLCVPINPQISKVITPISGTMGIAINGILYRPNTAGYWDPKSPRGHSTYGDKNWRLNIFATRGKLGLDNNNGHVGPSGLYHYHGIAKSLIDNSKSSLTGYAGDGFEIHYVGDKVSSGWSLKKGERAVG